MRLVIDINCGERTCYAAPGDPCQFLRTRKYGQVYYCAIWQDVDSRGRPEALEERDGWLLRCPECLEAGKGE